MSRLALHVTLHMHASISQQAEAIDMTACVARDILMLMGMHSMLRADRLMGFKENAREVAANLPGLLQKEKY